MAAEEGGDHRLTLLVGGDTVYVYPTLAADGVAAKVAVMRAVLDVAYPAGETWVARFPERGWAATAAAMRESGIEIVDTRDPVRAEDPRTDA